MEVCIEVRFGQYVQGIGGVRIYRGAYYFEEDVWAEKYGYNLCKIIKFILVNIAFGWLMDFLIFKQVNEAIDSFFTSMNEYDGDMVGVEAEGATSGSSGETDGEGNRD